MVILDEDGNEVKAGVSGELYVGGDLLARGYINRPETTARPFCRTPSLANLVPVCTGLAIWLFCIRQGSLRSLDALVR